MAFLHVCYLTHHVLTGHFPNEILPTLLFLDTVLPSHVPLLWPEGGIASHVLEQLQQRNALAHGRPILMLPTHKPSLYRVKSLYMFRPARDYMRAPYVAFLPQKMASFKLASALTLSSSSSNRRQSKPNVVVLRRGPGARSISNHDGIVRTLQHVLGPKYNIDEFIPGTPLSQTAQRVHRACLFIGPQ